MLVSKRIPAVIAALALALPVAPPAVAYDQICVRNDGHFHAYFQITFRDRKADTVPDYRYGRHTVNVNFSDKNDSAPFSHEYWSLYNTRDIYTYGRGGTRCLSKDDIAERNGHIPSPGEAFSIKAGAVGGEEEWCHQANNHRRWNDAGNPWHRVFTWPEKGGRLDLTTWGTSLNLHCDIRNGEYMWEGCAQGREGFRKSACYPWRPALTGRAAYDLTSDPSKSIAYLASVARRGANLDARVNNEYPLHVAVRLDRLEHTKVLLGQGPYLNAGEALDSDRNRARLNWQNANGESPLYLAAQLGRVEHARALIANRADVNLVNAQGNAPLHAVALSLPDNFAEMVNILAGAGADMLAHGGDGRTPLMMALEAGATPDELRALVAARTHPEQHDRHRAFSPIHRATALSTDAVAALISTGANIDIQDGHGLTPLLWASDMTAEPPAGGQTREEMALAMIELGASPSMRSNDQRFPLLVMVETGMSPEGLRAVVAAGAAEDARGNNGYTPLHAAIKRSPEVVKAILSGEDVNVNMTDRNGFTPLMWAATTEWRERAAWGDNAQQAFSEIIDALMEAGANPEIENRDGKTALALAEEREQPEYMKAKLRQAIAWREVRPDEPREDGQTALQIALSEGDEDEARRMLELGADPNLALGDSDDNGGRRPLMIAVEERLSTDLIREIVAAGGDSSLHDRHRTFSPLHKATDYSIAAIEALLSGGADINVRDGWGRTPFFWNSDLNAAAPDTGTREEMALAMLEMGADPAILQWGTINRKDYPLFRLVRSGMSPEGLRAVVAAGARGDLPGDSRFSALHAAVKRSVLVVQALLATGQGEGLDVNVKDGNGFTPLMWAMDPDAELEDPPFSAGDLIDALLSAGADPLAENNNGETAISLAEKNGMPAGIIFKMRVAADPEFINTPGENGLTPLQSALESGDEQTARALLHPHHYTPTADPNEAAGGRRPLMIAVEERLSLGMIHTLIDAGGDPTLHDADRDFSALHKSVEYSFGAMETLLSRGADINTRDGWGRTPLFWASDMEAAAPNPETREEFALLMIERGADPAIGQLDGRLDKPLIRMVETGMSPAGLRAVVAAGGRADEEGDSHYTALHAGVKRSAAVVEALLSGGADVDAPDENGLTPLMWAMNMDADLEDGTLLDVIDALLNHRANPLAENNDGDTVISLAEAGGMPEEVLARLRAASPASGRGETSESGESEAETEDAEAEAIAKLKAAFLADNSPAVFADIARETEEVVGMERLLEYREEGTGDSIWHFAARCGSEAGPQQSPFDLVVCADKLAAITDLTLEKMGRGFPIDREMGAENSDGETPTHIAMRARNIHMVGNFARFVGAPNSPDRDGNAFHAFLREVLESDPDGRTLEGGLARFLLERFPSEE